MKTKFHIHIICSLFLVLPFSSFGQDVHSLLKEAQILEDARRENEALRKYQEIIRVQPDHLVSLCRASELVTVLGSRLADKPSRMEHFRTARRYAETALKVNPASSDANFVMAVAMGRMALVLNGQDKITAVHDIKRYAEQAIRHDPSNFKAYHVLGKWHYEVSSLNAFERIGVKLLFGGLPPSSFRESIKWYEKSRALNPGFALNYLEVAKAYLRNNQEEMAIEVLSRLQAIPVKTADDPRIKKEGNTLLKRLRD